MAKQEIKKLLGNEFSLTGKVNYIDVRHIEKTGTCVTRVLISKKGKDDNYESFGINFFGETAEKLGDSVSKGDVINVTGKLSEDSWEKDGKKMNRLELVGFDFVKARYDEDAKSYVAVTKELPF